MFAVLSFAVTVTMAGQEVSFPDRLIGHWTQDTASCGTEDTRGVVITADRVQFYEAVGTPKLVRLEADGSVATELDYVGEGKRWSESARFTVSPDDRTLRLRAFGRELYLQRCQAV